MKIFLIWPSKGPGFELGELMKEIEKGGHKIIYWVGRPDIAEYNPEGSVFHSYIDAMNGLPAVGLDLNSFPPIGDELIRQLKHTEITALTMMNRLYDWRCLDDRRHIYYSMMRYWLGVLKKYRPDFVIFPNTPHFVYNYVIYELARFLEIKTIVFYDSRIPGRLIRLDDFKEGCVPLKEKLISGFGKNISLEDLPDDIRRYYEDLTAKNTQKDPSYIKELKRKHSLFYWILNEPKIIQSILNLTIFVKLPRYIFYTINNKGSAFMNSLFQKFFDIVRSTPKKEYQAVSEHNPDFSKNFVYFPLQVQPEATTCPHGDVFDDQILAIETLSFCMPSGWMIYVKEHPMQWLRIGRNFSSNRYRGYYRRIAEIPNVKIIPIDTGSARLIEKSQVVATVTGSAAWESVLRGKPAIIFGHPWFKDLPGLLKVGDAETCKNALQKIQEGFDVNKNDVLRYLACLGQVSVRGFVSHISGKYSGLTKLESMRNIAKEILKELK